MLEAEAAEDVQANCATFFHTLEMATCASTS